MVSEIIDKLNSFFKSDFFKNVSILTSGSIIGQFILLGISPVLTRIYSPEHFGILSLFTSITIIISTFVTGKYEFAIALPEKDEEGLDILMLCGILSIIFSLFLAIILCIFKLNFLTLSFFKGGSLWLVLIPVNTLIAGINTSLIYWHLRKELYKQQSIYNLLQAVFISLLNVGIGTLGFLNVGLEISYSISQFLSFVLLIFLSRTYPIRSYITNGLSIIKLRNVAIRYSNFPKYYLGSQLLTNLIQQTIPIIFASIYTASVVGFFALSNRILRLPVIIVSNSISGVFRNDALKQLQITGKCDVLLLSTLKKLIFLGLPVLILLYLTLPFLIETIFGKEWSTAGIYGRLMCAMIFFDFISTPITQSIFIIKEAQKSNLIIQIVGTCLSIIGIYIGYYYYNDAYYSIVFYCFANIIYNLIGLRIAYILSSTHTIIL